MTQWDWRCESQRDSNKYNRLCVWLWTRGFIHNFTEEAVAACVVVVKMAFVWLWMGSYFRNYAEAEFSMCCYFTDIMTIIFSHCKTVTNVGLLSWVRLGGDRQLWKLAGTSRKNTPKYKALWVRSYIVSLLCEKTSAPDHFVLQVLQQLVPTKSSDWTRVPWVLIKSIAALGLFTLHVSLRCHTSVPNNR